MTKFSALYRHIGGAIILSLATKAVASGEVVVTPGVECNAVTPGQATRAEWREYGIVNTDKRRGLWVSCPLARLESTVYSQRGFTSAISIFNLDNGPILNAPVTCQLKEMVGAQRVGVNKAHGTVESGKQNAMGLCNLEPTSWASSFIYVCLLPPSTGISALMTESHQPGEVNSMLALQLADYDICTD